MSAPLEWDSSRPHRSASPVFIGHAPDPGVERGFVRWLAERLVIGGHDVIARADDLRRFGGDAAVEAALKAAPLVVLVLTRNYLCSETCLQELHWARDLQQTAADMLTETPSMCSNEGQLPPGEQPGSAKLCRVMPVFRCGPDAEEMSTVGVEDLRDGATVERLIRRLHPSAGQDQRKAWVADLLWLGRLQAFRFGPSSPECVLPASPEAPAFLMRQVQARGCGQHRGWRQVLVSGTGQGRAQTRSAACVADQLSVTCGAGQDKNMLIRWSATRGNLSHPLRAVRALCAITSCASRQSGVDRLHVIVHAIST